MTTLYKTVKHHQTFSSLDCTTKLNSIIFPDSKIASKHSTAKTKTAALIKNLLAPHSVQIIKQEIQKIPFYGISTNSSNLHVLMYMKMFPILIHYFTGCDGLKVKLLELQILPNETSDTIVQCIYTITAFCIDALNNYNIPVKGLVAFRANNANTNFGGRGRNRVNNVFYKLKETLSANIERAPAHIIYNTASTATDVLSIESVVLKFHKFFSIL